MPREYLLSVDGGGIRGIIPAVALAKLEATTRRPARETFSFVAGTSTGAIIAAAIAAGIPASRIVELSPGEAEIAAESLDELSVYGFEAEPFGPRSIRVTAVISTLADRDIAGAFKDALAAITSTDPGHNREDQILATIACHSAVKMGDRLSQPEMEALIRSWLTSRLPATCPHGRSICFRIGLGEVARKLDRH